MARVHTHYDNLKVARDAPPEVIRAAYKTLSQKHHPDRNGNSKEAIRIIQLINTAYEVLSDPVRRKEHDEWIARTEREQSHEPAAGEERPHSYGRRSMRNVRRSHGHSAPLSRLAQQAGHLWERVRRKLTHKVFRKV